MQVAVVGDEGGCGRTWLTLSLASALGTARRGGVIAWDGTRRGGPLAAMAEPGGSGLEALVQADHPPVTMAAMTSLTSRQDSTAEVMGWKRPSRLPLNLDAVAMTREAISRHYALAVVDTDADPWGEVWEAVVASSDAVVVIHSGSAWAGDSVRRTCRRVRAVAPRASIVGAALAATPTGDVPDLPWVELRRPSASSPAAWTRMSHQHQAELMRLARVTTSTITR